MPSIVQFFVIVAAIGTTCGLSLPVSSSSRDYLLIGQREFLHEIETVQLEVNSVNARFADRLQVIQSHQQQLLIEIVQVNKTLMPLQALSLVRKHCIQKFDSQLLTYETAKDEMKLCYDKAANTSALLTKSAQSLVNTADNEARNKYPQNVANCERTHAQNETALQLCYIKYFDSSTYQVNYYLNTARDHLGKALYDSSVTSDIAVKCSFVVEKDTLETIGTITKTMADCESSLDKLKTVDDISSIKPMSVESLIMSKLTPQ